MFKTGTLTLKLFFTLALMFLFIACTNIQKKQPCLAIEKNEKEEDNNLKKNILKGDTIAYFNLRRRYFEKGMSSDFLFWALLMSNKYQLQEAYNDVFLCIQEVNKYHSTYDSKNNIFKNLLDKKTIDFGIEYINKMSNRDLVNKMLLSNKKDTIIVKRYNYFLIDSGLNKY